MASQREESVQLGTGKVRLLRGGSGRSLLFLHHSTGGLGWVPMLEQLSQRFDVIAPDLPGYSGSDRPEWAREPRDLAVILGQLVDRLQLANPVLVGAGFGGFLAAEMAAMRPLTYSHLVLIGAAGLKPRVGEIADQMMVGHSDYIRAGFRDAEHFARIFGEQVPEDVRQLWDFSREMTARVTWKPYMFSLRLEPLLKEVKTRTLLLWGEQDQVVPLDCAHRYSDAFPNAQLQVVTKAGHLVELEEPQDVAQRITAFVS